MKTVLVTGSTGKIGSNLCHGSWPTNVSLSER